MYTTVSKHFKAIHSFKTISLKKQTYVNEPF